VKAAVPIVKIYKMFQSTWTERQIRRRADKSFAFPVFLFAAQPKEFFWAG
jgi:hypothetical protein